MKKLNLMQITSLVLASSLSLFSACQPSSLPGTSAAQTLRRQDKSGPISDSANQLGATGTIFTDSQGKQRLRFSLMTQASDFKTQALECGTIDSVSITISGIGIAGEISIATNYNPGSCSLTSDPLPEIPVGNARFVKLIAYNSSMNVVGELKSVVRIYPGQTTSFELSQRTWVAAELLKNVLLLDSANALLKVSRIDLVKYQNWIDKLVLGVSGNFPNYTYLNPPRLIDFSVLVNIILNANNDTLPTTLPNFLYPHAPVTITVLGITPGESLKVWITDQASPLKLENNPLGSSRTLIFPKVPLGDVDIKASNDGRDVSQSVAIQTSGNSFTLDLTGGSIPIANWEDLSGGPGGGRMLSLVKDNGNGDIFTASENGHVFRSSDSGANWSDVSASVLDTKRITALATDHADTVYAGTVSGLVFKRKFGASPDADWVQVGSGSINGGTAYITRLYVDPEDASRLYAGTLSDGIHEWNGSWSAVNSGLGSPPFAPVKDILKDPVNDHFYVTLFKSNGLYKTSTANFPGSGWSVESTGLSPTHFPYSLALSAFGNKLLLGTSLGGFYTSDRNTTSWLITNGGLPGLSTVKGVIQLGDTAQTIYTATENSLYKGVDANSDGVPDTSPGPAFVNTQAGANPFPPDNPSSPRLNNIVATSPNTVLVGTMGAGMQKWNNSTLAWSTQNTGIHNAFIQDLLKVPANGSALYAATHSGVMRSTDNGVSWQAMLNVASTGQERIVTALTQVPGVSHNDIYMGTDGDGVFLLDDATDGTAVTSPWSTPFAQPANQNIKDMLALSNGAVLAATTTGTFAICSTQVAGCNTATPYGFSTWTNTDNTRDAYSLALKPTTVDYVYAGGLDNYHYNPDLTGSGLWLSVPLPNGAGSGKVVALATSAADPTVLYAGVKDSTFTTKVYKSTTSGGLPFATGNFPASVKDVYALYVDQTDANYVYAGTNDGVYMTTDGGVSWTSFNSGNSPLGGIAVTSLTLIGNDLYAGTAGRSFFVHSFP